MSRVQLPGSNREAVPGAVRTGDAPSSDLVHLTVVLKRREPDAKPEAADADGGRSVALAEHAQADPQAAAAVEKYLTDSGLTVESADAARRTVRASGPVSAANAAFGVTLGKYTADGQTYRGREGAVHVPERLADSIEAVLGLDNRIQAHTRLKRGDEIPEAELPDVDAHGASLLHSEAQRAAGDITPQPLWPAQVAELYDFPSDLDGSGVTVGIIELGGGYTDADLSAYFAKVNVPAPEVVSVSVGTGSNQPGGDADGEVLLDIEVCGAIAHGAKLVVYFSDPSDRGFFDAISGAVHDSENRPSVISISWGGAEDNWTGQSQAAFDGVLADAAALGITVLAASGDHGAGDGGSDGKVHVDFPAASSHVVGCGGTTLSGSGDAISSEVVWNDGDGWAGGGGISRHDGVPSWQRDPLPKNLTTGGQGRGVPDIAGNADITSGFITLVDGKWGPVGGTSAVAPLYAGLFALINQQVGTPVGPVLARLYALSDEQRPSVFRDVTSGDNSVPNSQFGPATTGYSATAGWDACTGLGSIRGQGLLALLAGAQAHAHAHAV